MTTIKERKEYTRQVLKDIHTDAEDNVDMEMNNDNYKVDGILEDEEDEFF